MIHPMEDNHRRAMPDMLIVSVFQFCYSETFFTLMKPCNSSIHLENSNISLKSQKGFCRREGMSNNLYYRLSKDFLEAGKKRLMGDTTREAKSHEASDLKKENEHLKQLVAEIALKHRVLKKSLNGTDFEGIDILGTVLLKSWRSFGS
jgi:hypothetical protein